MKTLFASLFTLLLINLSLAQNIEGSIHYKETIRLDIDLEGLKNLPEEIRSKIPKEKSSENVLIFYPEASLYANTIEHENKGLDNDNDDVQMQIQIENKDRAYFYDVKKRTSIERKELFGKKFLVENTKPRKWKISTETKEILGYICKKATTTVKEEELIVWFTSAIPVEVGPSAYHGLPGAILSAHTKARNYEIVATKVALKKVDRTIIVPPKKGKKITAEEFKKVVKAKHREMAEEYGGDGNVIIKGERIER